MKTFISLFFILFSHLSIAQSDSTSGIKLSGFADIYFNKNLKGNHVLNELPGYFVSYSKVNQVNVNLAQIKASYEQNRLRANIALGAGTFTERNFGNYFEILEANIGVKVSKKNNIWFSGGAFLSHIGFESAISTDNLTLSRSILAENSPYYEKGARLDFTDRKNKLFLSILYLNPWFQESPAGSPRQMGGMGTQITYNISPQLAINYSLLFEGNKNKDVAYHNFFVKLNLPKSIKIIGGYDNGTQFLDVPIIVGNPKITTRKWNAFSTICQIPLKNNWAIAARYENFKDPDRVFLNTDTQDYIKAFSVNIDKKVFEKVYFRIEYKKLFPDSDQNFRLANVNPTILSSIAVNL